MKVALAQLNYHIGNFEANSAKIIQAIDKAKKQEADLIVFAELAICGYPPRDFLEFDDFIDICEEHIHQIAKHCIGIKAILGSPSRRKETKGKDLYNSAFLLSDGKVEDIVHKTLLPTYDVFDENRYFESNRSTKCISLKGHKIALTICEDLWNIPGKSRYRKSPMEDLILEKPSMIINIAASPFSMHQGTHRKEVFDYHIGKYNIPLLYVNHIGAQTELIFDGNSLFLNKDGKTGMQLKAFEEDFQVIDLQAEYPRLSFNTDGQKEFDQIESALVLGIKDYFKKLGFKKATLGLSGGIDSALSLVLAVKALGAENVFPILMPSNFSSDHSIDDSITLCQRLNCNYQIISIEETFQSFNRALEPLFKDLPFDLAEENIQSRTRGTLLMAYANKFGAILLNTSNKSELAVGYGTLYGDMSGGISVLGDLYKTEVYALSEAINKKDKLIPKHIIEKEPSAELRPNQKDSDSLPDYEALDKVLSLYIEENLSPSNIIAKGLNEDLVRKTIRLVNINEYKRHQAPPILRISDKAFGMGRRMPIVGKYLS